MGRPCVCGAAELEIDLEAETVRIGATTLEAGDEIAIDGSTGAVTADEVELIEPRLDDRFVEVLGWADQIRKLGVRANADTPADARPARELGAEGIGLCRTEHMFFGPDREELVRDMFIAAARRPLRGGPEAESELGAGARSPRRAAAGGLRRDLPGDERAPGDDSPAGPADARVRLRREFRRRARAGKGSGDTAELSRVQGRIAVAEELKEVDPMLGTRGARLGLLVPELYEMQVRAIVGAALDVGADGEGPRGRDHVPLGCLRGRAGGAAPPRPRHGRARGR